MQTPVAFLDPYEAVKKFEIEQGMKIADFGCGAGHFSMALAGIVGEKGVVSAIDINPSVLQALQGHIKLDGLFQVKVIQSDLEQNKGSTLEANSQDRVLCSNILHQAHNKNAIFSEALRVLKPQGRLIVIDWTEAAPIGPPERISKEAVQEEAEKAGFILQKQLDLESSHYGLVFIKNEN